ncbi:hypothetical protein ACWKT5_41645 [Streptomyces avermitilis]
MGDHFQTIVDPDASAGEAPELAARVVERLVTEGIVLADDDCFAFGHLGFEFWNWPEFTPGFRADIARLLDGHRTAYVWGKF